MSYLNRCEDYKKINKEEEGVKRELMKLDIYEDYEIMDIEKKKDGLK